MDPEALVNAARDVRARAHAPYSKFHVGAALLAKSGALYTGVNVENSSYGLTICAERAAICTAVTAGDLAFEAVAVVAERCVAPCGACRQVLAEFEPDLKVYLAAPDGPWRETSLGVLLPEGFSF